MDQRNNTVATPVESHTCISSTCHDTSVTNVVGKPFLAVSFVIKNFARGRHSKFTLSQNITTKWIELYIINSHSINELYQIVLVGRRWPYKCDSCERSYKHKHHLVRHKRYECGVEAQFPCNFCNLKFKHRSSLKIHVGHKHLNLHINI